MVERKPRRSLTHWTVFVPLLALAGWAVGFIAERVAVHPERALELTPPPQSQLQPIVLPPRARFLAGRVVGPHDEPIVEALVSLVAGDEPHWTYTDRDGAFRLDDLSRGPWSVSVVAAGHDPIALTLADDGKPATIRLNDEVRATPSLAAFARATLTGHVNAMKGESVAGFEVALTPVVPPETLDAPLWRRATCDAEGEFTFDALIAGEYAVSVIPEWAHGGSWPDLARPLDAPLVRFEHDASAVRKLEVTLESGSLSGRAVDVEGHPLEGALLLVTAADSPDRVWPPVAADATGSFQLGTLPAGKYALTLRAGAGVVRETVEVRARESLELSLPPLATGRVRKEQQ